MYYRFSEGKHVHEGSKDGKKWTPLYGTTTIINEVYPPPLAWYGSGKALEPLGFITEKKEPAEDRRRLLAEQGMERMATTLESENALDDYMALLDECYRNHDTYKKARGKVGTNRHAEIEEYIKACIGKNGGKPLKLKKEGTNLKEFVDFAEKNVGQFLWSEAHCFSEKLWCGGITDFGFVHLTGQIIIGDAKPSIYHKHYIQTAAYGLYIKENGLWNADGTKYGTNPVGQIDGYCIFDYEKGQPYFVGQEWVKKMESDFIHTVEMYARKDMIGAPLLETKI